MLFHYSDSSILLVLRGRRRRRAQMRKANLFKSHTYTKSDLVMPTRVVLHYQWESRDMHLSQCGFHFILCNVFAALR